jgi:cytochrome c biogenesis protein ResB
MMENIGQRIQKTIVKSIRLFKGVKLAAVLIALLILIYFLGLVLPQKWMFDTKIEYDEWLETSFLNRLLDSIGFTDIYLSPLTLLLLSLFFINLTVVIIQRVPLILRKAYLKGEPPSFTLEDVKVTKEVKTLSSDIHEGDFVDRVKGFFKRHGWHLMKGSNENTFLAIKNRFSPIGFFLFHLSFLLLLIGALMVTYTRFSGSLVLTEGQSFGGDIKQFHKITKEPKVLKALPALALHVEKVRPFYEEDVPSELVAELSVKYREDMKREILRVNEPIKRGPMSIIVQTIGISPLFVVKGPSGRVLDGVYVSLNVLHGEEDKFQFETDKRFTFYVRFFPDYIVEKGVETTKTIELKNPAMHLVVDNEGRKIYEGTIKKGDTVDIEPFTVSFEDIRYWADFMIVREYGRLPLVMGFLFASIGLIMRLVFYQKRIRLAIDTKENKTVL